MKNRLIWMKQRLASMSVEELPHRIRQQFRMYRDRNGTKIPPLSENRLKKKLPRWPICPFSSLEPKQVRAILDDVSRLKQSPLSLLGVDWPPYQPSNWSLDPVSRTHWPQDQFAFSIDFRHGHEGRDVKLYWEQHRLQHLQLLSFGAALGDLNAQTQCVAHLRDWLDQDQPFKGLAYASGIECALRVMSLLFIVTALPSDALTKSDVKRLWQALHHHGVWLRRYPSLFSSANNHRIAELSALCILEILAPELPQAAPNRRVEALVDTAEIQFHPDGVGTEQSVHYQSLTMEWLLWVLCLLPDNDQAHRLREVLGKGSEYLRAITDVNGNTPQIGDGDDCVVFRQRYRAETQYACSIAGAAAIASGRSRRRPPAWTTDLRALFMGLAPCDAPDPLVNAHFGNGGMSVLADEASMLVFDHGPLGFYSTAGHGHADALSLWLHIRGQPIWVDWGTYRYNGAPLEREWARSTAAHNTIAINGISQSQTAGPFNWSNRAQVKLLSCDLNQGILSAEHNGYGEVIHRRDVHKTADQIQIVDRIFGKGSVRVAVRFLLHSDCRVVPIDNGWRIYLDDEPLARFTLQDPHVKPIVYQAPLSAGPGGQSPCYNQVVPANCLSWEGRLPLNATLTLLWTWETAK